ncbi:unnamed protein product, partial [Schistosoma curassoni]|uniref:Histone deacetylase n=1 Tax=Schistosoma curassoni TaxID=6186 RepID=A0A183KP65_9TREM
LKSILKAIWVDCQKTSPDSTNTSDNNDSVITYSPCSATPFEADNVGIGLTPHLMLDNSISNLIMSSASRSKTIDNIKTESVIDFIANEVTKRIISRNNVIVYSIPDRIPIKTVRNSILKASNLQDSPCQCIGLNKKHQKYSCPVLFRFDSHILAERLKESEQLICALTKFRNAHIVSDKTTNQRLTQKRTLNENKEVEITTNHDASAAGSTDPATLSHVLQYSDIPTKNANLPVMSVVISDSQCTCNDVTNPILPSLPLEAQKQVLSSKATTLKNAVKIKILLPRKKNVSTEPSGFRPSIKNTTMTLPNKNKTVLPTPCFTVRVVEEVIRADLVQMSHKMATAIIIHNYSQHFPIGQDGLLGYSTSNALNNKPVRHNYSQHFPIGQDGLLGYASSTQLAGACLNYPPNQVQQINPLYQNNDFFCPSEIPSPISNTTLDYLPQSIRTIKSLPLFVRCIDSYCSSENALYGLAPVRVSHSTSDILGTLNVKPSLLVHSP